mmetsp:Transcript_25208/g.42827  ORF Transcript_25208/g.42827 Transcript_25208/m.42827 type:complete len:362 (-) Transcript_25208:124-1209(-)
MPTSSRRAKSPTKTTPSRKKTTATQKSTAAARKQPPKSKSKSTAAAAPSTTTKSAAAATLKIKQEDTTTTAAAAAQHQTSIDSPADSATANNNNNHSGIDEVLSESDQLLRAAAEAQALGRLRNASTYLLLAHARLVGLGRRFDRSRIERSTTLAADNTNEGGDDSKLSAAGGIVAPLIQGGDQSNMSLPLAVGSTSNAATSDINNNNNNNSEPSLFPHQTLHHMPDGVAYVEHLARAAMELHHKRTGRGMQHDTMVEKQNAANKAKQVEQEQIRLAARGLFATAKGFTGVSVGAGSENSRDAPPATRKRKATEAHLDTEEKNAMAKRKGGRGKKPPTLVMHTVMGKSSDVHDLMKGGLLN